jgi:hypothetical protein
MHEIQFAKVIVDRAGNDMVQDGTPMTLGRACMIALDQPIDADKNEGLKPKLTRGRLIETIGDAEKQVKPLALEAGDIDLIKKRVAALFMSAYFVRTVALLLDPATKE